MKFPLMNIRTDRKSHALLELSKRRDVILVTSADEAFLAANRRGFFIIDMDEAEGTISQHIIGRMLTRGPVCVLRGPKGEAQSFPHVSPSMSPGDSPKDTPAEASTEARSSYPARSIRSLQRGQFEEAGRLAALIPGWRWLPGMAVMGTVPGRIVSAAEDLHQNGAAVVASHGGLTQSLQTVSLVGVSPDLTDPATLGCMRACGGLVAELAGVLDGGGGK